MEFPAFVSKSYTLFSRKGSCARTVNLGLEKMETDTGKNAYVFYKSPGLKGWLQPSGGSGISRGSYEQNERLFHVVDNRLYNIDSGKSIINSYTAFADDHLPVYITGSVDSLVFVSAGTLYRINAGTLSAISTPFTPTVVVFIDQRFVALSSSNQQFFWSDDDGVTWDPLDFQTAEATANLMIGMFVLHPELWIVGNRITQVFTVGTDPDAPFVPRQDAVIQEGTAARASVTVLEGSPFWISKNKNGERKVIRMNGFTPERISKHNIENAMRGYSTVDDAIGQAFQIGGHSRVRFTFPTADATWEYDATVDDWVEVLSWDSAAGQYHRHRANTIVSAFGTILCGDHTNGWIMEMSPDFYSDDVDGLMGTNGLIRWLRRAPHLVKENKKVRYKSVNIDAETGVGDGSNGDIASGPISPEYDPLMMIRFSDDGGETYSSELTRSMGRQGQTGKLITINNPGTAIDRVWETSGTASVKIALFGMNFDAETLAH